MMIELKKAHMTSIFFEIENIFKTLKREYSLEGKKINEFVYQLSNEKIEIIFMFERFEESFSAFLKDLNEGKQYPVWRLFEEKGRPQIDVDFSLSRLRRNLVWHETFFSKYLSQELNGDFSQIDGVI